MIYILWSGGWDSTYLLCKRAREVDDIIQPVYEVFPRPNTTNERKQRLEILSMLREKADIKATIRDPIEIAEDALPPSEEYNAAYDALKDSISHMYRSIGKMALLFPGAEIGIEAPAPGTRDIGRIEKMMINGGLEIDDEGNVTPNVGDKNILLIYGGFKYPLLHINAAQMLDEVKEWGYEDIFRKTRSCVSSLGRQCGVCNNCEVKWKYGDTFSFLFDDRAKKDHKIKTFLQTVDSEKGTNYAELFTQYIMNGDWVSVNGDASALAKDSSDYQKAQQQSGTIMQYFSLLENNWPDAKNINAPII